MINPKTQDLINDLLTDNKSYYCLIQVYKEKIKAQTKLVISNAYCSTYEYWAKALQDYADLLRMIGVKRSFEKGIQDNLNEIRRLRNAK